MPLFDYLAARRDGTLNEGVVEAGDEAAARAALRDRAWIPLKVRRRGAARDTVRPFARRTGGAALAPFTTALAELLGAGLTLEAALGILAETAGSRRLQAAATSLRQAIRAGLPLSGALQRHPELFDPLYVNLVRAGEAGGALEEVLARLGDYLAAARELREGVVTALIYPAILTSTGFGAIALLALFVLPRFTALFADLGTALPLPTRLLLAAGEGLAAGAWPLSALAAAAAAAFRYALATEGGRCRWDALKLRLLGELVRPLETARFCRTLGTLLAGGVPLLEALEIAREAVGNRAVAGALAGAAAGVREGRGIAAPLSRTGVLPLQALAMIRVGEETGALDRMLLRAADASERHLRRSLGRFLALLEPLLILAMGLVIGFIVLSMLLAVFSIAEIPL